MLKLNDYEIIFKNGGIEVCKNNELLYRNRRPVYVSVKDYGGIVKFRDIAYDCVEEVHGSVYADALFTTENGSVLSVSDTYRITSGVLKIQRKTRVEQAHPDDLGFQTKISFYPVLSDEYLDYDYFSPGQWYKHNEFAGSYALFKRHDLQYYWRKETNSGLPLFAMQHIKTGETISMSRFAADATLPSLDRTYTENYAYIDKRMTVGSFGVSKAQPESLTYTYYGHLFRTPLPDTQCDGLSIDYIYPAVNGQDPIPGRGPYNVEQPMSNITWVHPMQVGFMHDYSVAVTFDRYSDFSEMMKETWRIAYYRLKDRLFKVDNEVLYENIMRFLKDVTRSFGNAWGTPFVAQLPDFDPNSFSAEIGFVGQQAGIGYQLLRWGYLRDDAEAIEKGLGVLNYWTDEERFGTDCPRTWTHLSVHQDDPQPEWIREMGDGLEAILDAYLLQRTHGVDEANWMNYLIRSADWLLSKQEADGSLYRSYYYDGTPCMDSKASTPCIVRFLVQLYIVTKNRDYLDAAIKAGEWTYINEYLGFEYRGGTCDQSDVMDKESGIYAMWAFLALYDILKEEKWLKAACAAADYVETFTFVSYFPVDQPYPNHPFTRNHVTGTSNVTVGHGGGDCYMAACSYTYYRLYLLTGDDQYRDFAEFINKNVKQANDIDGSCGYKYIGLINEGGGISDQQYHGRYHWLPWCSFVEVDPASRFYDSFGAYEVDVIERLPLEERKARNDLYNTLFWKV